MMRKVFLVLTLLSAPALAGAEGWSLSSSEADFRRVESRETFVDIVRRGELGRFGITLKVEPDGKIRGRAFGRTVTGAWNWRDGYFCRDLNWGSTALGGNCQAVEVSGDVVRFTSDQGTGPFADLRLK